MKEMVGAIGFEPTTPCAQGRCATRLRYAPTDSDYIRLASELLVSCDMKIREQIPRRI